MGVGVYREIIDQEDRKSTPLEVFSENISQTARLSNGVNTKPAKNFVPSRLRGKKQNHRNQRNLRLISC